MGKSRKGPYIIIIIVTYERTVVPPEPFKTSRTLQLPVQCTALKGDPNKRVFGMFLLPTSVLNISEGKEIGVERRGVEIGKGKYSSSAATELSMTNGIRVK